jgi:hypothetical protein
VARKLIAGGLVVAALLAGLAGVSAYVIAADHSARVPAPGRPAVEPAAKPTDADAALDLSNWQETRNSMPGSNSIPTPPKRPVTPPGLPPGRP